MKRRVAKKMAARYLKRKEWTPYGIGSVVVGTMKKFWRYSRRLCAGKSGKRLPVKAGMGATGQTLLF